MTTASRLTIVLPLKGRHLFTLRFLWHANKARLPYRFLVADGQVHEDIAPRLKKSRELFPELDIEYICYPDDTSYSQYFAKMADALERVQTPYAMLADNDDFLARSGIDWAVDFLDANSDYVCARGRMAMFSVYSKLGNPDRGLQGRLNRLYLNHYRENASAGTALERFRQAGTSHLMYYAVYRTEALRTLWREDVEIDFSDLMLHESFHAMRTLTFGKLRTNEARISYFNQVGASLSYQPLQDWVHHLLRSRFTSDAHAMVEIIATAAERADDLDKACITEEVYKIIEQPFRQFLSVHYGLDARIKRFVRRNLPRLARVLQNPPPFSIGSWRWRLFRELTKADASQEDLRWTAIEIAEVESALSREAFAEFAGPFLRRAHDDGTREWV